MMSGQPSCMTRVSIIQKSKSKSVAWRFTVQLFSRETQAVQEQESLSVQGLLLVDMLAQQVLSSEVQWL